MKSLLKFIAIKQKFRYHKFYLYNTILESLRRSAEANSMKDILSKIIDIQILKGKGILKKAVRIYKKLKEVLVTKRGYDLVAYLMKF